MRKWDNRCTPIAGVSTRLAGYLWKKRSNDVKFAWQPNPIGGALIGTDQWGLLVATQDLLESRVGLMVGGGASGRWLIRCTWSEFLGPAPGQESLTPGTWPLNFPRSLNTTLICGCLATRCKALSGRGGVAGARRWGWRGWGPVWRSASVFFLPNMAVQHWVPVSKSQKVSCNWIRNLKKELFNNPSSCRFFYPHFSLDSVVFFTKVKTPHWSSESRRSSVSLYVTSLTTTEILCDWLRCHSTSIPLISRPTPLAAVKFSPPPTREDRKESVIYSSTDSRNKSAELFVSLVRHQHHFLFKCIEILTDQSGEPRQGEYSGLPGALVQVEDRVVQTEGCWWLQRMAPSSRGRAGLRVRQPEDRLKERRV